MRAYSQVLFCAFLIVFVSIGLGRFSFGMVLPNLQENLQISTTLSGFIGTANFIGYFVGIFFVSSIYKKYETSGMIFFIIVLQAISMFLMALSSHYLSVSIFFALTGFFSAISNVSIMVYIAHVIPQKIRGKALGIPVAGIGLGIIFSGFLVPVFEEHLAEVPWRSSWIFFAVITLLIALYTKKALKTHDNPMKEEAKEHFTKNFKNSSFWKISLLYLIFGITYVVYVTYFVLASIEKYDFDLSQSGYFWSLIGTMSLISGPLFGSIADKIGGYKTLMIIYTSLTIANLILALDVPAYMLVVSAITFGISAWSIPSLITLLTSIHFGKAKTAQVFSMVTIIFAAGQTIGPVFSGYIYDKSHSFDFVFLLCSIICFIGVISAFIFSKKVH